MPFNWKCPYCQSRQTVVSERYHTEFGHVRIGASVVKNPAFELRAIGCCNPDCAKPTVMFGFGSANQSAGYAIGKVEFTYFAQLIPDSSAKPQPDYLPKVIVADYIEACKIRELSPKASATLARRCLQGVIRDYCKISKNTLFEEIKALRDAVDAGKAPQGVTADTVDAIDHVRQIGNIGAHMEKDINVIVDVEPNEAKLLIELIESLFDEWYVARHRRAERFKALGQIAKEKKAAKSAPIKVENQPASAPTTILGGD